MVYLRFRVKYTERAVIVTAVKREFTRDVKQKLVEVTVEAFKFSISYSVESCVRLISTFQMSENSGKTHIFFTNAGKAHVRDQLRLSAGIGRKSRARGSPASPAWTLARQRPSSTNIPVRAERAATKKIKKNKKNFQNAADNWRTPPNT